jgi:RHS repeat-associated protein
MLCLPNELTPNGEAQVISAKDYYPFGLSMPSRSTEGGTYRYGFNGKETDQETGIQDYGMRWYLPNIARFPSIDPLTAQYPKLTPYQFASNTPIVAIDIDGLESDVDFDGVTPTEEPMSQTVEEGLAMANKFVLPSVSSKFKFQAYSVTVDMLKTINPDKRVQTLTPWVPLLNEFMDACGINTPLRKSHFLAQICQETDGFRVKTEECNYRSIARIRQLFKSASNMTDEELQPYVNNSEAAANKFYSNRMGNGDEASGDGFKYRGRGLIQLTGKDSYSRFTIWYQKRTGESVDFAANPELVANIPRYSIASAIWEYVYDKKLLLTSDINSEAAVRKIGARINGTDPPNGYDVRLQKFELAKKAFNIE